MHTINNGILILGTNSLLPGISVGWLSISYVLRIVLGPECTRVSLPDVASNPVGATDSYIDGYDVGGWPERMGWEWVLAEELE